MPEKNNEIISQINAISAQTRIGRQEGDCSFEIAKNTFEKIEKLKPDIFSALEDLFGVEFRYHIEGNLKENQQ